MWVQSHLKALGRPIEGGWVMGVGGEDGGGGAEINSRTYLKLDKMIRPEIPHNLTLDSSLW